MQAATARRLTELLLRHAAEQKEVLFQIKDDEPDDEFQRIKLMIGHTMASLYLDALRAIFAEHPTLKPPELE